MLTKKEITSIIIVVIVLAFVISLVENINIFLNSLILILIIILVNLLTKKATSFYLDSEIETKLWTIKRYGFRPGQKFSNPFPAGLIFPLVTTALTFGYVNWMASLVFDIKPKVYRAAKRHGLYNFSEIPEYHLGLIAASGIIASLITAIIGYLIGQQEFAKISIYYAFFNMIPFSDLDGNKIFFGSLILWSFLGALTLVGLFFALFAI